MVRRNFFSPSPKHISSTQDFAALSGVFSKYSRVEIKQIIEDHGGKIMSSISKNTTFVLTGNNIGPSKKVKALDLGIPLLTEEEFLKKID